MLVKGICDCTLMDTGPTLFPRGNRVSGGRALLGSVQMAYYRRPPTTPSATALASTTSNCDATILSSSTPWEPTESQTPPPPGISVNASLPRTWKPFRMSSMRPDSRSGVSNLRNSSMKPLSTLTAPSFPPGRLQARRRHRLRRHLGLSSSDSLAGQHRRGPQHCQPTR